MKCMKSCTLPDRRIIVPEAGKQLDNLRDQDSSAWKVHIGRITLNDQMEGTPNHGVPSYSYLFEVHEKKWFIPGDTRTYDPTMLHSLGPLNGLISHVWLGRRSALIDPPPLIGAIL